MRRTISLIAILFWTISANAQLDTNDIEKKEKVCYSEDVNGAIQRLEFIPYTYHGNFELKFQSGYQITVEEENAVEILDILSRFNSYHKKSMSENINSPQVIDYYKPKFISKGKKVIDAKAELTIYYCLELKEIPGSKGNLIIKIPELTDMFGGDTANEHYVYISGSCLKSLIESLK